MQVVSIISTKGGVGKTTTAINLAASLAVADQRVLVIDMDPQGNLTSGLGQKAGSEHTVYEALVGAAELPVLQTAVDHLHLVPADRHLAGAEVELVTMDAREQRLKRLITPLRDRYDFILIDCTPSLGLLVINALTAADSVLIRIQTEYLAARGALMILSTIETIRRKQLNPKLEIEGILLTMADTRTSLTRDIQAAVAQQYGHGMRIFNTVIRRSVRFAESAAAGRSLIAYDPRSAGANAYRAVARELGITN